VSEKSAHLLGWAVQGSNLRPPACKTAPGCCGRIDEGPESHALAGILRGGSWRFEGDDPAVVRGLGRCVGAGVGECRSAREAFGGLRR